MKKVNETPVDLLTNPTKESIPRILLEVFLYGEEKDKEKIKHTIDDLQRQLNQARANKNKARILWYIDNGEKSPFEKIEWFYKNTNCKYFIILDGTVKVDKAYLKNTLQKIRTFEYSLSTLKSANIFIYGKHFKNIDNATQEVELIK